ncbi:hypothetical protein [Micromonospora sp. RTGN7]|uniref:hypothetical protein n=1 Tax=Micromonospora sp. RTGN7 TaxID=3016526 RepID=UPI0029FF16C1|nr:hypothetical protein [Micromonospora sp. RTGN7]
MDRSLIVADVVPTAEEQAVGVVAEPGAAEPPHPAGVRRRPYDLPVHPLEIGRAGRDSFSCRRRDSAIGRRS